MLQLMIRLSVLASLAAMLTASTFASEAVPTTPKRIALVFDDGPRPADAEPLLALLAREKITATFAFVGDRVNENPATAKAVAAAGHEIVNHSQRHLPLASMNNETLASEVSQAQQAIKDATGISPRWYWPPYLAVDDRLRAAVLHAGLVVYEPSHVVVSKDYDKTVSASEIFRLATTDIRDGSVILFHEWRVETREQLPAIFAELRRQNCAFLSFSALHHAPLNTSAASTPTARTAPP